MSQPFFFETKNDVDQGYGRGKRVMAGFLSAPQGLLRESLP